MSIAEQKVRAAFAALQQGVVTDAEARCREALAAAPRHGAAFALLAAILISEARFGEAQEMLAELIELEPRQPAHWVNLGTARRGAKRLDEALVAYARAAELGAADADFYYNLGLTHIDRSDFEAARAVLEQASTLAPRDAEIRYRYAKVCYERFKPEDALRALEGWEELSGITPELLANIGYLLMNLGETARAEAALQQTALHPSPGPRATLTLVEAYERLNRLKAARALLDAVAVDPQSSTLGADLQAVQARLAARESRHEEAIRLLKVVLGGVREPHLRHYQLFSLAKSLDALGHSDEALRTLEEAHASQVAHLAMTAPAASWRGAPTLGITQFGCDPADVAGWDHAGAPPTEESPVFIVAFPRSGTTLLELALDAHPGLVSMDEQPFLQNALADLLATGVAYPRELRRLSQEELDRVRSKYWGRVRTKVRFEPGQRLIDKNPLNILRLPVIARLFPNSRILLALRHPCDVIWSCYMQHFRAPEFALLCADLARLAQGFARAFDFCYRESAILRPAAQEVRYETLVGDFEGEMRAIADFLKLPWDERLLAPATHARSKGFISTPSYSQVVQPLNRRSLGRWRPYADRLSAILPVIQPYLDRWGYDTL
ncbi:MAG: tetratricopeptide repeat-containing sulfotransferase family protein [Steroidobacteraceae bacterium]